MGAITPLGNDVDTFWDALKQGKNGIDKIDRFDVDKFSTQMAALVGDFDPQDYMDRRKPEEWIDLLNLQWQQPMKL